MAIHIPTIDDLQAAVPVIRKHMSHAPLIRSYALEKALDLPDHRRVWLKDYGWTPVGSFKLMGALNWVHHHAEEIGNRPIAAHSSGNFASGISFAGMRYHKRVIIVMPDTAPNIKFERTRSFGAEIHTYDIANDHQTGERMRMTRQLAEEEGAIQASPYDDPHVIAGNGVGGLEIVDELKLQGRTISHFFCPVSGGGLMAGHALAVMDGFPDATVVGVEPKGADDFSQSLHKGERVVIEKPDSICDGLCSYSVGEHNWPILNRCVSSVVCLRDSETVGAMHWLYHHHGLQTEPSGAISVAALLKDEVSVAGDGDIVLVISGRNVDPDRFSDWVSI